MNQDTIEELAPAETLQSMLPDPMIIQLIYVAAKLRLADLMRDGPKHVSELAAATETDAQALFRLLRALASIRVFAEGESRVFELTPIARLLRTDIPESMHL